VPELAWDVCVVGGCGRVGLPLALTLAAGGRRVAVHDIDDAAVATVRSGRMPFSEDGADEVLADVLGRSLHVANDEGLVSQARWVIVIVGTPVDEHLNPTFHVVLRLIEALEPRLTDGQCLLLRSTLFPGTTEKVCRLLADAGRRVHVAFCPERIAEGRAMTELRSLPQIVSGCDEEAAALAEELFSPVAASVIRMTPLEAELTKVFANAWRYIQFATANQFFMIAAEHGLEFHRIHDALTRDYPRMAGLPSSGFAAGPCLLKDTMQLAAAHDHSFFLGHAAMLINEGLPAFLVRHMKARWDLGAACVGILGMAFKGDSDDPRESLSYKLRKVLSYEAREVLCSDPLVRDEGFVTAGELLARADLVVVGAPHSCYRELEVPPDTPVVDVWNLFGRGTCLT